MNQYLRTSLSPRTLNRLRRVKWTTIGLFQRPFRQRVTLRKYKKFYQRERNLQVLGQIVRPGATVIDVGSNIGAFSYHLSGMVGDGGLVVAFEPRTDVRDLSIEMMGALAIRNIQIEGCGLSSAEHSARLHLPTSHGRSSLFFYNEFEGVGSEEVLLVTLDGYLKDNKIDNLQFMKIDVEGHEASVIQGAKESLDAHRPLLLIEAEERHLRPQGRSIQDFVDLMNAHGYAGYGILNSKLRTIEELLDESNNGPGSSRDLPIANFWFIHKTTEQSIARQISDAAEQIS